MQGSERGLAEGSFQAPADARTADEVVLRAHMMHSGSARARALELRANLLLEGCVRLLQLRVRAAPLLQHHRRAASHARHMPHERASPASLPASLLHTYALAYAAHALTAGSAETRS